MSKIEEALRKAASRRNGAQPKWQENSAPESAVKKNAQSSASSWGQRMTALLDVVPIKINNLLLATARDEKNAVVEEFSKLRSVLIALTRGDEFRNTLLVTSTVSEEGKSMTALNLAISLAKEHDHTVLLVDADLRRPSVHKYLDIEPEFGLVHCLRDNLPLEKALIKTGVGKLVVLPAGETVSDPVDILSSNRMKAILQELKTRYPDRYVIVDSPPALPFADASVLASIVDSTLFVVREGRAKIEDIAAAIEELREHGLLGVVYNDAHEFLRSRSYYYYYY